MIKEKQQLHGKAIPEAWDEVQRVARNSSNYNRLSWCKINYQLKRSGNVVDTTAVPASWTNESPQMSQLRVTLQKAGFREDGHLFVWRSGIDSS